MKLIVSTLGADILLIIIFWQFYYLRINLLLCLAMANLFFFFYLLFNILARVKKTDRPKSLAMEFVMCNSFMVISLGIFRLVEDVLYEMCF